MQLFQSVSFTRLSFFKSNCSVVGQSWAFHGISYALISQVFQHYSFKIAMNHLSCHSGKAFQSGKVSKDHSAEPLIY